MCTVTVWINKSLVGRTSMKQDVYDMCVCSESSSCPSWTIRAAWATARDRLEEECYCLSFKVDLAFVGIRFGCGCRLWMRRLVGVVVTTTVVELASK